MDVRIYLYTAVVHKHGCRERNIASAAPGLGPVFFSFLGNVRNTGPGEAPGNAVRDKNLLERNPPRSPLYP